MINYNNLYLQKTEEMHLVQLLVAIIGVPIGSRSWHTF